MAKWADIKCTNCTALEERLKAAQRDAKEAEAYAEELQAEIDFLNAQLEAWQAMAPPPEKDLLRKRLEERRAAIRKGGE